MSIDDNHQNLSVIQQALEDYFDVISSTGEEPIEDLVRDCEPDIILLDILLSNTTGYEICRQIRSLELVKKTFIVFVSSLSSTNDKLKAYAAGGDDYICKPINLTELVCKLEAYEKRLIESQKLRDSTLHLTQWPKNPVPASYELGLAIAFFNQTLAIRDFDSLYWSLKTLMSDIQLGFVVEFRTEGFTSLYPKEQINQLELEIFELSKRTMRNITFGRNILFNTRHCSFLVKQLPENESEQSQIKEYLTMLLNILDGRIATIEVEQQQQRIKDTLIADVTENHSQIRNNLYELEMQLNGIFAEFNAKLEAQFKHSGINQALSLQTDELFKTTKQAFEDAIETALDINFNDPD